MRLWVVPHQAAIAARRRHRIAEGKARLLRARRGRQRHANPQQAQRVAPSLRLEAQLARRRQLGCIGGRHARRQLARPGLGQHIEHGAGSNTLAHLPLALAHLGIERRPQLRLGQLPLGRCLVRPVRGQLGAHQRHLGFLLRQGLLRYEALLDQRLRALQLRLGQLQARGRGFRRRARAIQRQAVVGRIDLGQHLAAPHAGASVGAPAQHGAGHLGGELRFIARDHRGRHVALRMHDHRLQRL